MFTGSYGSWVLCFQGPTILENNFEKHIEGEHSFVTELQIIEHTQNSEKRKKKKLCSGIIASRLKVDPHVRAHTHNILYRVV